MSRELNLLQMETVNIRCMPTGQGTAKTTERHIHTARQTLQLQDTIFGEIYTLLVLRDIMLMTKLAPEVR